MRVRAGAAVLAGVLLLTGCGALPPAPSPTTTHTDASGEVVTVDWADYPAHAGNDGEALLGRADQSELEPGVRELMARLRAEIERASGLELEPLEPESSWFDDENWFPQTGNGYGGESMLITINCCELSADRVPDTARWRAILDAASRVTEDAGLGPLVLDIESEAMAAEPSWERDYRERYCNAAGGECWLWSASAFDGVQWVYLTIRDGALDRTGDAAREAEEYDRLLAGIDVAYGATVVRAGMADEFARAIAPFVGLDLPDATTSD